MATHAARATVPGRLTCRDLYASDHNVTRSSRHVSPLTLRTHSTNSSFATGNVPGGRVWARAVASHMSRTGVHRRANPGLEVLAMARRKGSARSVVMTSLLIAEPQHAAEVREACGKLQAWAQQQQERGKVPGCLQFEVCEDTFDEGVFHFWEHYASTGSLQEVQAQAKYKDFLAQVRPKLSKPIGLGLYEYRDGSISPMRCPIGPKGEGGLDDATNQAKMSKQHVRVDVHVRREEESHGVWWGSVAEKIQDAKNELLKK